MPIITWDESLSVGVAELDNQHKKLIDIINTLHDAMAKGQGGVVLNKTFSALVQYTRQHFTTEERYFERFKYPASTSHRAEHEDLTVQVLDLKERFESGRTMLSIQTMNFLKDWLQNHIRKSDKQYGPFFNECGLK
ncbi:MAG TPA: bacteriohemerythrin [Planctomycetota bacterium]|jgi:hemerythrin-like metal-binding protein